MKKGMCVKIFVVTVCAIGGLLVAQRQAVYVTAAEKQDAAQTEGMRADSAEEQTKASQTGQLMTADGPVDLKASPEDDAETITTYQKGDPVFVTGEAENGWCRAVYRDREGYVPTACLHEQEMDVAGLDAEMERTRQEAELVVETVERYRAEARRSRIWGSVIAVLVLGIFATGIISGVRSARAKDGREEQSV